ncbi:amidase [Mesorhizobium sp. L-8-10]|uniref:amidase n=1 Tax=Mesorhizobium sp. L-8-10 TaxID=2744523 RepID=UPI00192888B2|nr:amidase [Mesorhizobium sp. L-8-10]BCH29885.1 amidase [Mesorhizobium sp. L-8-10]
MEAIHEMTIAQLSFNLKSKEISPRDVLQSFMSRAKKYDRVLNVYAELLEESAVGEALQAEREITAGQWRGPLHGVPIGLKDVFDVKGFRTAGNCRAFSDHIAMSDSDVTAALRKAGTIIIGKATTMELALGDVHDVLHPPVRNPWDITRDPGASSSGPAAGVAACFFPGAVGTDTGSSIRQPAALCGVAGFKPTYEAVSRRGTLPISFTMDHCGPLAWSSEDCRLLLDAIASDARIKRKVALTNGTKLNGVRIGLVRNFYDEDLLPDDEVRACFDAGVKVFRSLGAKIAEIRLPSLQEFLHLANLIWRPEALAFYRQRLCEDPQRFSALVTARLEGGDEVSAHDYINALRRRAKLIHDVEIIMRDVDILLTPSCPSDAPILERDATLAFSVNYQRPFNITGQPALSVFSGFSRAGLPLAIQIVGRCYEDDLVLRVGEAFEKATSARRHRPVLESLLKSEQSIGKMSSPVPITDDSRARFAKSNDDATNFIRAERMELSIEPVVL